MLTMKLKFSLVLLALSAFLFGSCDHVTVSTGDGDSSDTVTGNGKVAKEEKSLVGFSSIELQGVFNVFLSQGNEDKVVVETDENLQPYVVTYIKDDILTVKLKDSSSIKNLKQINVYIQCKNLNKISSNGVGRIQTKTPIRGESLELDMNGVGASDLNIQVNQLTVRSEVVGAMKLSGRADHTIIHHQGLGAIDAQNLITQTMNLSTDGIGAAQINVTKELTVDAKGLGAVLYRGHPAITHIHNEGVGKVVPEEE